MAWRVILLFPAVLSLIIAWAVVRHGDDTPKGNTSNRLKEPALAATSLSLGVFDLNTWLLAFQYGCCFGVEITMIQAAALYFQEEFGQSTEAAAAIASIFGWMNLFARGIGGFSSDMANAHSGLRGRLFTGILCKGTGDCVLKHPNTGGAIFVMMMFSILFRLRRIHAGIKSYQSNHWKYLQCGRRKFCESVLPSFRGLNDGYLLWMGFAALGSAFLTAFIHIRGHRKLLSGKDSHSAENRVTSDLPYIISFASPPVDENAVNPVDAGITETEEP
jgi:NNP family nitrate/nitrite transporter-like MFS transporter